MKFFPSFKISINKKEIFYLFVKNFFRGLAKKPLPLILILFLISCVWGAWLSYRHIILNERLNLPMEKSFLKIEDEAYQRILLEWEGRKRNFEEAGSKRYLDIFSQSTELNQLTE